MDGVKGALHVISLFEDYKKADNIHEALLRLVNNFIYL